MLRRKHHLTPDEVAAWRDGELDDPALEGHVLSCKSCQASLAEARLTRHLIRASQSKPVGEHIAPSEIGEYFDALFLGEWMGEERIRAIGAHLDSCSACLKRLLDFRTGLLPSADLRERIFVRSSETSSGAEMGKFGLFIRVLAGDLVIRLQQLLPLPSWKGLGANYSARRGPVDMSAKVSERRQLDLFPKTWRPTESRSRQDRNRSPTSKSVPQRAHEHLSWANASISISCAVEDDRADLGIMIADEESGKGMPGIKISARDDRDSHQEITTGDDGFVGLSLPLGRSTLNMGTVPPLEIEVEFERKD